MTRKQLITNWELVEAFKNGADIQYFKDGFGWTDIDNPSFCDNIYRIKSKSIDDRNICQKCGERIKHDV